MSQMWVPVIVAIGTVIANAIITNAVVASTVTRHEGIIEELRRSVHDLTVKVAVLSEQLGDDRDR